LSVERNEVGLEEGLVDTERSESGVFCDIGVVGLENTSERGSSPEDDFKCPRIDERRDEDCQAACGER
jgi:hypothetical protein